MIDVQEMLQGLKETWVPLPFRGRVVAEEAGQMSVCCGVEAVPEDSIASARLGCRGRKANKTWMDASPVDESVGKLLKLTSCWRC